MADMIALLPLLRGWIYQPVDIDVTESIEKEKEVLSAKDEKGWVLWAVGLINNKNASIRVTVDGYYTADATPYDLYLAGLTMPNSTGFWLGHYDASANVYCVIFSPPYPWGFKKSVSVRVTPPTGETIQLYKLALLAVRITDEKEFRKSLKELGI
jgi:hypothetical protein